MLANYDKSKQEMTAQAEVDPSVAHNNVIDGLLAATAKVRGLTFVTRNTSDIARTGVMTLNPWHNA